MLVRCEQRIAREAIVSRCLQPLHGLRVVVHERICGRDIVRRMVEMTEAVPRADCLCYLYLRTSPRP